MSGNEEYQLVAVKVKEDRVGDGAKRGKRVWIPPLMKGLIYSYIVRLWDGMGFEAKE